MTTTSVTPTARERWSRSRVVVAIGALVVLVAVVLAFAQSQYGRGYLDPTSVQPSGSRALAELLRDAGVDVHDDVREDAAVLERAGRGTTVLVTEPDLLTPDRFQALLDTGADLVLAAATTVERLPTDLVPMEVGSGVVDPDCPLPEATRAGPVTAGGVGYTGTDAEALCYPTDDAFAVAVLTLDSGATVTLLGAADVLTNWHLDEEGNAALAMNLLGRHRELVWFQPRFTASGDTAPVDLLPDWVRPVLAMLGVAVLVAAVWRGRRMGRLVTEPLPVVVRASETAEGRGRLYRHGRDRAHSASVLRGAAADRLRARLGLPGTTPVDDVTLLVARHLDRSEGDVRALLDGDPPADDAALIALADDLDTLEAQVHARH